MKRNNESEMEEKIERRIGKQVTDPAWIIRWHNPYGMECKSGPREAAIAYADEKARETGNTYEIF